MHRELSLICLLINHLDEMMLMCGLVSTVSTLNRVGSLGFDTQIACETENNGRAADELLSIIQYFTL